VIFRVYPQAKNLKAVNIDCQGMVAGKKYKLEGRHLESIFSQTSDSLSQIFTAGVADTIPPEIAEIKPEPSEKPYVSGFDINFYFSESINQERSINVISIKDNLGKAVRLVSKWEYPNQIIVKPEMKDAEEYVVSLDEANIIDMQGNKMGDSVVTYKYITASADTLGQLSGRIASIPGDDIFVMVYPLKGDTTVTRIAGDGFFSFDRLYPSTYHINAYRDSNKNNKLDPGQVKPIVFSEPLAVYADTIVVRPRWETDIGLIDFGQELK